MQPQLAGNDPDDQQSRTYQQLLVRPGRPGVDGSTPAASSLLWIGAAPAADVAFSPQLMQSELQDVQGRSANDSSLLISFASWGLMHRDEPGLAGDPQQAPGSCSCPGMDHWSLIFITT